MEKTFIARLIEVTRASPGELVLLLLFSAAVIGGTAVVWAHATDPPPAKVQRLASVDRDHAPKVQLLVHVAGQVSKPGVYALAAGSRVADAVEAAGGAIEGADLQALNLAAKVSDGQKVVVPKPGEAPATGESGQSEGKINLNTASKEQLEELPSVGPVLADRIIGYRTKRGGFTSVRQLLEVDGFGPKKFESLKDLVTI